MADGDGDFDTGRARAVFENDFDRVADVALVEVVVVAGERRVLAHLHLRPQDVDARVGGHMVFVVGGGEPTEDQRDGRHVLQAVVAVGRVVQRSGLVDDPNGWLLRVDEHALDVVQPVAHGGMQLHGRFDGRLRVEQLGRRLLNASIEIQRWWTPGLVRAGGAAFIDVARAAGRVVPGSRGDVDAGVGVRLSLPGVAGVVRADVATGLRHGGTRWSVVYDPGN